MLLSIDIPNATKTILLVLTGPGSDPVKSGFIERLDRPGGNVTGITNFSNELAGKRLEILKEVIGNGTRVAVLYNPSTLGIAREVKEDFPVAARALKLDLQLWEVRVADDFDRVFAATGKPRPDGLYMSSAGALMNANRKRINDLVIKSRLPSMQQNIDFCRSRRTYVLRSRPRGELPARGVLRRPNLEGRQPR